MSSPIADKHIVLGITGSIAAYKVADWVRSLRRDGAKVTVIVSNGGARFVTPLTFAALSGNHVYSDMFDMNEAENIPHIELAKQCDMLLIAPASAGTIARLAQGLADDLLSTVALACDAPVMICPAMNSKMFLHPATQDNLARLEKYGYKVINPEVGTMACGDEGPGRLPEWHVARHSIISTFVSQDLAGKAVIVSAGPTWEPLDPVRFLSNRSSGKMGYAIAAAASQRGASVTLISGPTALPAPPGVKTIQITTAQEMYDEILSRYEGIDVVVKAAAVSDFRPDSQAAQKLKKSTAKATTLSLQPNPDILHTLGERKGKCHYPLLVGFAAESENHIEEGRRKLREKNLDLMVVNDITGTDCGFGVDTNRVTLLDYNDSTEEFPLLSKEETAHRIWDRAVRLLND
ncbi:MAG: bifunctional phosphopantothenoylcysteine decarboxylase/phosphopantothenate--cysteine ligase CoaBC [Desulfobulbaceae bacterium]|nr:bifunctional phosphopantothenoylcysteine decarboxylase/phosphopantothenate--cysteine ligase CoaBC [Desulfobulbaceae bacterium]